MAGRPTKLTDELADDRASRIDVDEGTRTNDRVNTEHIFEHDPTLAILQLDALDTERWAQAFADLAKRYKRGTLKKSREAFSMLYDHFAIDPNPVLLRSWRPLEFAESSCSSPGMARSSTCVARCRSATASGAAQVLRSKSPRSDWSPTPDHCPRLRAHGGHLTPDNVRLAHLLCNRRDYGWRMKINVMLGKRMSLDEIATRLNAQKVPPVHGVNRWTAASVRKAFVS